MSSSNNSVIELCHLCFFPLFPVSIHWKPKATWASPWVHHTNRSLCHATCLLQRSKAQTLLVLKNLAGEMLRKPPTSQSPAQASLHQACIEHTPKLLQALLLIVLQTNILPRSRMLNPNQIVRISLTSTLNALPAISNRLHHAL